MSKAKKQSDVARISAKRTNSGSVSTKRTAPGSGRSSVMPGRTPGVDTGSVDTMPMHHWISSVIDEAGVSVEDAERHATRERMHLWFNSGETVSGGAHMLKRFVENGRRHERGVDEVEGLRRAVRSGLRPGSSAKSPARLQREVEAEVGSTRTSGRSEMAGAFDAALLAAFDRIDSTGNRANYVLLSDLRKALPMVSREAFDSGINQLRRARVLTLDSADGRHVRLSDEQRAGGIYEGGANLVYVARR